jgi:hypothetical protein
LTSAWKEYTIDLQTADLSHIIGGFGFVLNAPGNLAGATFYIDEIYYDLPQAEVLRFLLSYKPIFATNEPDSALLNSAFIYDNALALLSFLSRGSDNDLKTAKMLADAFVLAQNSDRYYTDGRLRNGYMSGDLLDHLSKKTRLPRNWDNAAKKWYEYEFCASTHTGNLAWVIIALADYYEKSTAHNDYLQAAQTLGTWIIKHTKDFNETGGYTGGYYGFEPDPKKITWKSTEHNIDLYVAFMRLAHLTQNSQWVEDADHAKKFVELMWNPAASHFWTGTLEDGLTINKTTIALDTQSWSIMAFNDYFKALKWTENNCALTCDGYDGFDFNTDKDGVWFEGTGQMVIAYQAANEKKKAMHYCRQLTKSQTELSDTGGIMAAGHDNVSTGFEWVYHQRLHVGATAWYILANHHYNPYWGKQIVSRDDLAGNWENLGVWTRNSLSGNYEKLSAKEAFQVTAADYNHDDLDDVIGWWETGVWVYKTTEAQWEKISDFPISKLKWITASDLNGSGHADIIGSWENLGVWVRYTDSKTWEKLSSDTADQIVCADLDGDNQSDLLGSWAGKGIWLRFSKNGIWKKIATEKDLLYLSSADTNGDGIDELLGSWTFGIFTWDYPTNQWTKICSSSASILTSGDINGLKKDDLIGIWPNTPGVWARYSETGTWERIHPQNATTLTSGKIR